MSALRILQACYRPITLIKAQKQLGRLRTKLHIPNSTDDVELRSQTLLQLTQQELPLGFAKISLTPK